MTTLGTIRPCVSCQFEFRSSPTVTVVLAHAGQAASGVVLLVMVRRRPHSQTYQQLSSVLNPSVRSSASRIVSYEAPNEDDRALSGQKSTPSSHSSRLT